MLILVPKESDQTFRHIDRIIMDIVEFRRALADLRKLANRGERFEYVWFLSSCLLRTEDIEDAHDLLLLPNIDSAPNPGLKSDIFK